MSGENYNLIREEFEQELTSLRYLIKIAAGASQPVKVRLAAANSCTLLLAATFEEFVREMAREHARFIVRRAAAFDKIPKKLISTAWKRSIGNLARITMDGEHESLKDIMVDTKAKFATIHGFVSGDINQDIYQDLIQNEGQMRPKQINELFNIVNLKDICKKIASQSTILEYLGETNNYSSEIRLKRLIEDFIERRNDIAHALRMGHSNGESQIISDIELLRCVALAMEATLREHSDCIR